MAMHNPRHPGEFISSVCLEPNVSEIATIDSFDTAFFMLLSELPRRGIPLGHVSDFDGYYGESRRP
jgi:hypothetical protein